MSRSNNHRKEASRIFLDPFGPKPDKRFYYAFEAFEQRLAILRRLIQGTDALILVVGERGSGKSTLLQRVLVTTDKPWKPCRVQTAANMAVGRLSRLKQRGNPAAFLLKDPNSTIILMDDAHRLKRKELRKLLRDTLTPDPARKIKRMVLFGEPRVSENFDAVSGGLIDETALNKIYLPTITMDEAAAFIRHRLAVAGFTGKNPFTPAILKNLYDRSAGLPGRINEGAARLWTKRGFPGNATRGKSRSDGSRLLHAAGWTTAALAAAALSGFFWMYSDSDTRRDTAPKMGQQVVRVKIPGAQQKLRPRADIASETPTTKIRSPRVQAVQPAAAGDGQKQSAPGSVVSTTTPAPRPEPKSPDTVLPDKIYREEWLLAQDPAGYTIQLLGVRNEQSLLAFIADHQLGGSGQVAYYRSRFRGGIWYPLVYGAYPTLNEARQAITGLPESIRDMSPWIRKMSTVHAEIRKAAKS